MLKILDKIGLYLAMLITIFLIVYGAHWIGKKISFKLFYGDMVKATITEMVKPEALK